MLKNIMLVAVIFIFTGCSTFNKIKVVTLPPSWIGMNKIATNVYVDADMNLSQQNKLLEEIPKAKKYVINIWGKIETTPVIYACSTKKCAKSLGIGARAYHTNLIALSPKALNKELISHEFSHAELYKRVGGFLNWRKIPSWFDEGVAVLAGHDPRHDERAWQRIENENLPYPSTDELISTHQWVKAVYKYQKNLNKDEIVVVYAFAGHKVAKWYKRVGVKGLNELIKKIKEGEKFEDVYDKR